MQHVLRCAGSAHLTACSRILSPELSDAEWQYLETVERDLLRETVLDAVRAGELILDPTCRHAIIRSAIEGHSVANSTVTAALDTMGYGLFHHNSTPVLAIDRAEG